MRLLLLHLSDVHIKAPDDPVFAKFPKIVEAVRNLDADIDCCVVALTGDIAFSGAPDQYLAALDALGSLKSGLTADLRNSPPVYFVALPGNHDCDFTTRLQAREQLLASLPTATDSVVDASIIAVCTEVQSPFFDFRDTVCVDLPRTGDRLLTDYSLVMGADSVVFRCINTAWLSRIHEQQGALHFPVERLGSPRPGASVVVALFHHPYQWLKATNARAFRKRIEATSDIVLTGHEHDITLRMQEGATGELNCYVEGGALQELGVPESAFNALILDVARRKQKMHSFTWDNEMYVTGAIERDWDDFQMSRIRHASEFEPSEATSRELTDLGVSLSHPAVGPVSLPQIFVYPDLREIRLDRKSSPPTVRGELFMEEISQHKRVLVTGPDKSGKSTFAKVLFGQFHDAGYVPLLLDGRQFSLKRLDQVGHRLEQAFSAQYDEGQLERYKQHDRARKAILIDAYDRMDTKRLSRRAVLGELLKHADILVLFAGDVTVQISELMEAGPLSDGSTGFRHYGLLPFGHYRRNELAEKWLALDPSSADEPQLLSRRVVDVKRMMDVAIGANFVPSFPVFLLPILQADEHSRPVDVSASTYGYFYELLIRQSLAVSASREQFDIWLHYLAFLAYAMFARGIGELSEADLRALHADFERRRMLSVSFMQIMGELTQRRILEQRGNGYAFKYPYIAYYFVASYLRDHIDDEPVREQIRTLTRNLSNEDNANILLFLAHVSRSSFIIHEMLLAAAAVFDTDAPEDLSRPLIPPGEVNRSLSELAVADRPAKETRAAYLARMDEIEESASTTARGEEEGNPTTLYLQEMGRALKTLQILGQLLKSFPGSMDGELKMKIARACRDIGLRVLGSFTRVLEQSRDDFIVGVVETLRAEYPDMEMDQLRQKVESALFTLLHLASYGIVRRVSFAIGSPHLDTVYDALLQAEPSPFMTLVRTALRLDHSRGFPSEAVLNADKEFAGLPLPSIALRRMVVTHFHLFEEPMSVKQRVCDRLEIPVRRTVLAATRTKLIAKGDKQD